MSRFLRRKPRPDSVIPSSRQDVFSPHSAASSDQNEQNPPKEKIRIKLIRRVFSSENTRKI